MWLIALLFRKIIKAADRIALFAWKFWSDPPRHRVRYYTESAPRDRDKAAKVTIKRGAEERFFQH
ncbi:MAG: hypothetical protein P0Y59_14830 [Candidatus Sphingomonas phytovorans]|nr:hypothetical protein [Sphingomonas sp.]WEJ98216.1 MAG: hypothetical protein P0Y59_14830 [Sphingomonas sp.]